eukprot:4325453-Pleurochrysis_carterae.AAC.2
MTQLPMPCSRFAHVRDQPVQPQRDVEIARLTVVQLHSGGDFCPSFPMLLFLPKVLQSSRRLRCVMESPGRDAFVGRLRAQVTMDSSRTKYFSPEQAMEYGIIDKASSPMIALTLCCSSRVTAPH